MFCFTYNLTNFENNTNIIAAELMALPREMDEVIMRIQKHTPRLQNSRFPVESPKTSAVWNVNYLVYTVFPGKAPVFH